MAALGSALISAKRYQSYAHRKGSINVRHRLGPEAAETTDEPSPINGTNLIQESHGIRRKTAFSCPYEYFSWVEFGVESRGDCGDNRDGTRPIRDIVLENQRRPCFPNLRAAGRVERNEPYFSAKGKCYFPRRCHTSSSTENHSSASARSRSARFRAPSRRRFSSSARVDLCTY